MDQAQKDYQVLYQKLWKNSDSVLHTTEFQQQQRQQPMELGEDTTSKDIEQTIEHNQPALEWLLEHIWNPLRRTIFAESDRKKETTEARDLLLNMNQGTQTKGMFDNDQALLGYTRHKFVERAMLTTMSLRIVLLSATFQVDS
jgi:hypothetical protein